MGGRRVRAFRGFTRDEWARLQAAVKLIFASTSVPLENVYVGHESISFEFDYDNGEYVEGFWLPHDLEGDRYHDYYEAEMNMTKTGRRPYDEVVVAVLHKAKELAPDAIEIHLDSTLAVRALVEQGSYQWDDDSDHDRVFDRDAIGHYRLPGLWRRLRRHARFLGKARCVFKMYYEEVHFRPENEGAKRAKLSFESAAAKC